MSDESRDSSVPVPNCLVDTSALVPKCPDTSAPVWWCRNVSSLNCPGSEVSAHLAFNGKGRYSGITSDVQSLFPGVILSHPSHIGPRQCIMQYAAPQTPSRLHKTNISRNHSLLQPRNFEPSPGIRCFAVEIGRATEFRVFRVNCQISEIHFKIHALICSLDFSTSNLPKR